MEGVKYEDYYKFYVWCQRFYVCKKVTVCDSGFVNICLRFYESKICKLQRCLRDVSELYGSESSLHAVQQYRNSSGLDRISAMCFQAARISTLLIDDGIESDKKLDIEWHNKFVPKTGRILRIERLAEQILDDVR